jgi:excisionase family DNA binding protein
VPTPDLSLDNCAPVLKVDQAAQVALVDPKTIRAAVHRGELKALVQGRVIRVMRESLRVWLAGAHTDRR